MATINFKTVRSVGYWGQEIDLLPDSLKACRPCVKQNPCSELIDESGFFSTPDTLGPVLIPMNF